MPQVQVDQDILKKYGKKKPQEIAFCRLTNQFENARSHSKMPEANIEKIRAAAQASGDYSVKEGYEEICKCLEHILERLDELEYDIDRLKKKME
jgi:archaellum component FlaC